MTDVTSGNSKDDGEPSRKNTIKSHMLHIQGEGNIITNNLANITIDNKVYIIIWSMNDPPTKAKWAVRLEKIGLSYMQTRRNK